ncbi:hypothetical protein [Pontiella sulfatireligans]|uniref:Uncharacterized protein n=1 Tax=Pontiella sulfatireligans TaxID=2750658 RepID=A0A6C2UJH2_9BACT|nr:hypothetical protein [Pontiella sulfatireligans]VGO20248.1 hypothetical protein SCARR_02309 [Pontiella sulfatireligans]
MPEGCVTACVKIVSSSVTLFIAAVLAYWFNLRIFVRQNTHNKRMRQQGLFLEHLNKAEENIIKYWENDASNSNLGQSVIQNIEFLYKLISSHGEKFISDDVRVQLEELILALHRVATGGSFQSANKASPDKISKSLSITGEMKIYLFD